MKSMLLFVATLSVACASPTPPPTLYLLRSDISAPIEQVESSPLVGLGTIELAPYLRHAGILVETAPGQVWVARQHHWAEPLGAGVRAALRESLSRALGIQVSTSRALGWQNEVEVTIDQLHGTMDGRALIDARYRIRRHGAAETVTEYRFSQSATLPEEGYAAMVAAEAQLLEALAHAIAESLGELGAP